jgi:hypothetical protein
MAGPRCFVFVILLYRAHGAEQYRTGRTVAKISPRPTYFQKGQNLKWKFENQLNQP